MAGICVGGSNSNCGGLIVASARFRSASAASRAASRARFYCTSRTFSLNSLRHSGIEFRETPGNSMSVDLFSVGRVESLGDKSMFEAAYYKNNFKWSMRN